MGSLLGGAPAAAQQPAPGASALAAALRPYGGLSERRIGAVEGGEVVTKTLEAPDRNEVALLGVVAVAAPRAFVAAHALDPQASPDGATRTAFGIFGEPATVASVADLTLDPTDVRALAKCRPTRCRVKLPAAMMPRLQQAVSGADGSAASADALMRQWIVDYVNDYRANGDAAMPVYDDTRAGERSADGFHELLAQDASLLGDAPAFAGYLAGSPSAALPGVTTVVHWSTDHPPGLDPLLRVVQRTVYAPPMQPALTLVATKQLYASHYFDALLDLTVLLDRSSAPSSVYVVVVRRVRFDDLPSGGLFNVRGRVIGKLRDALHAELASTKQSLEASYRADAA